MPDIMLRILLLLFGVGILVGFPIVVYALFRMSCRPNPEKTFAKVYDNVAIADQPFPGAVNIKFHTYHGFFIYAI